MNVRLLALAAPVLLGSLLVACGDDDGDGGTTPVSTGSARASATSSPGAPTAAATDAATTAPTPPAVAPTGAGPAADAYRADSVYPHLRLDRMVGLHHVPGAERDAVVLTQQEGVVYRVNVDDTESAPRVFLDLSDKLIDGPGNEEGLLGFAFAPDFATSRRLYVYYTAGDPRRSVVARYQAPGDAADPASEQIVMEVAQPFANHNGGALVFGGDGHLYIALGDGGSGGDPQGNGQRLNTLLGKILRIDVSGDTYVIPPDNPFTGGDSRGEVWAYGLRNPWRITFDRATGALWAGDVGQGTWEEVDRIVRGGNYGWNTVEGPECFNADSCNRNGLIAPSAAYPTHENGTCSVTGGYVYRGAAMPELQGWYVYGDFCSGDVWAVNASSDTGDPVRLASTGAQISSFAEDPPGEIYLLTFSNGVLKLAR